MRIEQTLLSGRTIDIRLTDLPQGLEIVIQEDEQLSAVLPHKLAELAVIQLHRRVTEQMSIRDKEPIRPTIVQHDKGRFLIDLPNDVEFGWISRDAAKLLSTMLRKHFKLGYNPSYGSPNFLQYPVLQDTSTIPH